jgi:hypothetical protein
MLIRIVWLSVIRKGRVDVALVRGRDANRGVIDGSLGVR